MINGLPDDFESIKLMLPTGFTLGCESVEYGDEKSGEVVTGSTNLPPGIGRGEYKGTRKPELHRIEYDKLDIFSAASGSFFNMPPIPAITGCGNAGQPPVTALVHFTKRDFKGSKGGTNLVVSIEGALTAPLVSNGVPAYAPFL